ncbi:MAG TPA: hypothetical protein VFT42_08175, partial [Solirubrobacteraceae bacterium]|nr:hypothetical protein [Solirubrobacteraceae bacterium]
VGCGGGVADRAAASPRPHDGPAPIQLATYNCTQWRAAAAHERATVIRELHGFYGLPVAGRRGAQAYGSVLRDGQARALFDSYCRQPYARHFTLYKLYARATAFAGGAP